MSIQARTEEAWRSTPIPLARRESIPRYHRAPVGLGARTFREGFARGGRDALRRAWQLLPEDHRAALEAIAADYAGDADD